MTGRDPSEEHRAATPLELLFDLVFVVAIGAASSELAHGVAAGHASSAAAAFIVALVVIVWAWTNFSWFSSAYDTDDWFYRAATFVQMIGVVVVTLGIPALFSSIEEGQRVDDGVVVAGYVVMRSALVGLWLRAAREDPERRATCMTYVWFIAAAQIGWTFVAIASADLLITAIISLVLYALELVGPYIAETRIGRTPWHPGHIAERYGLFTIITLGESLFGTVTVASALIADQGWTADTVLLAVSGVALTFGLWWTYFIVPSGTILRLAPRKAFLWGYGHTVVFVAIAAAGAGLHIIAYAIGETADLTVLEVIIAVAVPVAVFCVAIFALYSYLLADVDWFLIRLIALTLIFIAAGVAAAAVGAPLAICLLLVTLSPFVVVIGHELWGKQHQASLITSALRQTRV